MVETTLYDKLRGISQIVGILETENAGRGSQPKKVSYKDIESVYAKNNITKAGPTVNVYYSLYNRICAEAVENLRIGCQDEKLWGPNGSLFSRTNMYCTEFLNASDEVQVFITKRILYVATNARLASERCMSKEKVQQLAAFAPTVLSQKKRFETELREAISRLEDLQKALKQKHSADLYTETTSSALDAVMLVGKHDRLLEQHANNPGLIEPFERVVATILKKIAACEAKVQEEELFNKRRDELLRIATKRKAEQLEKECAVAAAQAKAAAIAEEEQDIQFDASSISEISSNAMTVTVDAEGTNHCAASSNDAIELPQDSTSKRRKLEKDIRQQAELQAEQELRDLVQAEVNKQNTLFKGKWQDWYKEHKDAYTGKVMLICADPPYNVLDLERDRITQEEMQEFVDAAWSMLDRLGTVIIFCSWQQAHIWHQKLVQATFLVERNLLTVVYDPQYCIRTKKTWMRTSGAQYAVIAHKVGAYQRFISSPAGLPVDESPASAGSSIAQCHWRDAAGNEYDDVVTHDDIINSRLAADRNEDGDETGSAIARSPAVSAMAPVINNPHPRYCNVISRYKSVHHSKRLKGPDGKTTLRLEEKHPALYSTLYNDYVKTGDLVWDPYAGTFSSCLAALPYKLFYIGCEVDETCFEAASRRVLESVAHMINSGWLVVKRRIESRERLQKALGLNTHTVRAKSTKRKNGRGKRDDNEHDAAVGEDDFEIPRHNRPEYYEASVLAGDDTLVLCAEELKRYDVEIRLSSIANAGKGVFALRDFEVEELQLPYWGEILDSEQMDERYDSKGIPADRLVELYVQHKSGKTLFIDGDERHCLGTFVNSNAHSGRSANMLILESVPDPVVDIARPDWVCIYNCVAIKAGDELLGDYGPTYTIPPPVADPSPSQEQRLEPAVEPSSPPAAATNTDVQMTDVE